MKKLTITSLALSLIMGFSSSCKQSPEGENQKQRLEQQAKLIEEQAMIIKLFDNYYHSTEELLDSIHIDQDNDLETDAGAQYLEDRYNLNQLFNKFESNPKHHH